MAFPTRESVIDEYARNIFLPQVLREAERDMGSDGKRAFSRQSTRDRLIKDFKKLVLRGETKGKGYESGGRLFKDAQKFENYYGGLIQTELTRQENLYAAEVAEQRRLTQAAIAQSSKEIEAAQKGLASSQASARQQIAATEAERTRSLAEIEKSRAEAEAKIQQATEAAEAMSKRYAAAASAQTQAAKSGQVRTKVGSPEQLRTQPAAAKTPVGQPRVARTRLTVGSGVGGYGGTSAGQLTPTGLNI